MNGGVPVRYSHRPVGITMPLDLLDLAFGTLRVWGHILDIWSDFVIFFEMAYCPHPLGDRDVH
jgi:hypothetical protein